METKSRLITIALVLPTSDLDRDIAWYKEKTGFDLYFSHDGYAVLRRGNLYIPLQWHANTQDDPLLGGSVIRIFVDGIRSLFDEFVRRGAVGSDKFSADTSWGTNEFGFYDLNNNAILDIGRNKG